MTLGNESGFSSNNLLEQFCGFRSRGDALDRTLTETKTELKLVPCLLLVAPLTEFVELSGVMLWTTKAFGIIG